MSMPDHVEIYDTTLRDGSQLEGISLTVDDKLRIAEQLDWLGVHYIEAGWPGANPKDDAPFIVPRGDAAKLFQLDLSILRSTRAPRRLLKNDGTIDDCCVLDSVRVAVPDMERVVVARDAIAHAKARLAEPELLELIKTRSLEAGAFGAAIHDVFGTKLRGVRKTEREDATSCDLGKARYARIIGVEHGDGIGTGEAFDQFALGERDFVNGGEKLQMHGGNLSDDADFWLRDLGQAA